MKALMLVSAAADDGLRKSVSTGARPTTEYLRLESRYGVDLLDWSQLAVSPGRRSVSVSLAHCVAALRRAGRYDVIFSDGEHLGVPMGLALRSIGLSTPHVTIGHNLLSPSKVRLLRHLPMPGVDRVLVHSSGQIRRIVSATAIPERKFHVVPYGIDTQFWAGTGACREEEGLVVSAGREHRDYRTLVAALPRGARLSIADHSLFSPQANRRDPPGWPENVNRIAVDQAGLRSLYAHASVVVVPVVETLMPAGITTLLEAMSMGKAVVVSDTSGLRGVVDHGESGLIVPPGEPAMMRAAIQDLLCQPRLRSRLGREARRVARSRFDVDVYADAIASHLLDMASHRGPPRRCRSK